MKPKFSVGNLIQFCGPHQEESISVFGAGPFLIIAFVLENRWMLTHYVLLAGERIQEFRQEFVEERCTKIS